MKMLVRPLVLAPVRALAASRRLAPVPMEEKAEARITQTLFRACPSPAYRSTTSHPT